MKILSIVGVRPQFIKLSPISKEIRKRGHEEVIVHTGQHYDFEMDKIFFNELLIPEPDHYLGIASESHLYQIGEAIKRLESTLKDENPDYILVYGDANSTLSGALVASKLNFRLGHVEAGLRIFDNYFPEELNRVIADHCSDFLFCPTKTAVYNLQNEGIANGVYLVGDVMYDSLIRNIKIAEKKSRILEDLRLHKKGYLLATIHHVVDEEENLKTIFDAFIESNEKIILPLHPRTKKRLIQFNLLEKLKDSNIQLVDPVGYLDMLALEKNAKKIITDSGGVRKESYFLKVSCITLINKTEWVETVKDGWNFLAGLDKNKILQGIEDFEPTKKQTWINDGKASIRIVEILKEDYEKIHT